MESMTGYGRGECIQGGRRLRVQVTSVNHRHCDIRFAMARELCALEQPLRDRLRERLDRGSLQVVLEVLTEAAAANRVQVDLGLAREYCQQARRLQAELGLAGEVTLQDILHVPQVFTVREPETAPEELTAMALAALDTALAGLLAMRRQEGAALQADLQRRLATVLAGVARIRELAPLVPQLYREKLQARIAELLAEPVLDEERLRKEVAWFADKADISEELTRLDCHLVELGRLLAASEPVGRKLDFLLQEMNREVNTIGSKANHQEIAHQVVELKAELERMREQVQNVQ